MITDATLSAIATSTDQAVVIEIYGTDQTPGSDGFDPADALKRFASVSGITFNGQSYTRAIISQGKSRRTTTSETNTFNFELDNLSREASRFEFTTGFEGCIVVQRLISRSMSTAIEESIILFVGRCDKPTTGSKKSLPITAKQIIASVTAELPRRKFQPQDPNGRTPDDKLFEGFVVMPQLGTLTYTARERKGGLAGFLGFKHTVTKTLQYSSFSDLDAEKYLPVVFGRCQIAGTHMGYKDIGAVILGVTAFCEGRIQAIQNLRVDDLRFFLTHETGGPPQGNVPSFRLGYYGGQSNQLPHPNTLFNPNGYFSRTALVFAYYEGTNIDDVDAAPLLYAKILGQLITVPNDDGTWTLEDTWSDDPAAQTRFLLTSPDYYKLHENWLDDESFLESWNFNHELLFDTSNSDILFLPTTGSFSGPTGEKGRFLLSTGHASANYFKSLRGATSPEETFLQTALAVDYATDMPGSPADPGERPIDPIDPPGDPGTSVLGFYLRRRYTSNIVITEQTKLIDFLHDALFVGSRSYLTQAANGRIRLKNKKPADWALADSLSFAAAGGFGPRQWFRPEEIAADYIDTDPITTWRDHSTYATDGTGTFELDTIGAAITTPPTRDDSEMLNSLPVVKFDTSQYPGPSNFGQYFDLHIGNHGAAAQEMLIVLKSNSSVGANAGYGSWDFTGNGVAAAALYDGATMNAISEAFGTTSRTAQFSGGKDLDQWVIVQVYSAANDFAFYVDGELVFSSNVNTVSPVANLLGFSNLPSLPLFSTFFRGWVAEYILWTRKLATAQRASALSYAKNKFQIAQSLPTVTGGLSDNFDDNSLDGAKWTTSGSGISETNHELQISDASSAHIRTQITYDLTGKSISVQFKNVPGPAANYFQQLLFATDDGFTTYTGLYVFNGDLRLFDSLTVPLRSFPFDPVLHAYVRMRFAGGMTYLDTSADGSAWINRASVTTAVTITAMYVYLRAGNASGSPVLMKFDNFDSSL